MLPILLGYYSPQDAIIVSPLFFGFAHFHHMIEKIRRGTDLQTAFFISAFQVSRLREYLVYTSILFAMKIYPYLNGLKPVLLLLLVPFINKLTENLLTSVGFELGLLENKASMLTT